MASGEYYVQAHSVIEQYEKYSDQITLEYVDLLENPSLASAYEDVQIGDIIVSSGNRSQTLTAYDLFNVESGSYYGNYITSSRAEQAMTSAIMNVTSETQVKAGVLTGHSEQYPDGFVQLLENNNFEVVSVSPATEEIPEDIDVLIWVAPINDPDQDVLDKLDAFFDEVFQKADLEKMKISVKTRIGIEDAEEFEDLQKVFNRYPFAEVIIHPRVRSDFYKNQPNRQVFGEFLKESVNPVCYNGDIFTVSDAAELKAEFPELESIMCGRGLLSNPALVRELQGGETLKKEELHRFHDTLYESYRTLFAPDERSVLFKMKELWGYFITAFQGAERDVKKIKKAQHFAEYEAAVSHIFENHEVGLLTE